MPRRNAKRAISQGFRRVRPHGFFGFMSVNYTKLSAWRKVRNVNSAIISQGSHLDAVLPHILCFPTKIATASRVSPQEFLPCFAMGERGRLPSNPKLRASAPLREIKTPTGRRAKSILSLGLESLRFTTYV